MKLSGEVKIGIIITIAIAVTIWGLNFLKGRNILKATDQYYAIYSQIDGLEKNAKIFINGYKVGQVGDIYFSGDKSGELTVVLEIQRVHKIPLGSACMLVSADFMGTKAINIGLSENPGYHQTEDTLLALVKPGLVEGLEEQLIPVKDKAISLIVTLDSVMSALQYVFDTQTSTNLKESIENLKNGSDGIEELLAEDGKLFGMISNIESITLNVKNHNEQLSHVMSNMEAITDSVAQSNLKSTINNTNKTLEQSHQILEKINNGEGTLGMLVNNDTLYHNLEALSGELDLLLKDLQENPKKYINVSVFRKND